MIWRVITFTFYLMVCASNAQNIVVRNGVIVRTEQKPATPDVFIEQVNDYTLPELFRDGIAVLDDDGHAIELVPVGAEVIAVQVSDSPLDPLTRKQKRDAGLLADQTARAGFRIDAKSIKTNVVMTIRAVKEIRQSGTGLVDRVKAAQVGTNANAAAVRSGFRDLTDAVEVMAREKRQTEAHIIDLSAQVRNLADLVRQMNLKVDTSAEER